MMSKRMMCSVVFLMLALATSVVAQDPGTQLWYYRLGEPSSPAMGSDGTLYVGTRNSSLHAINPDGTRKWAHSFGCTGEMSMPVVGPDDTVYTWCSWEIRKFLAINPDGSVKWAKNMQGWGPAIGADGTLYVGHYEGSPTIDVLHALNSDGTTKWKFPADGWSHPAAIAADGTIYFSVDPGTLIAVYPDGQERWSVDVGGRSIAAPAIGADGTVYAGSENGKLYAINPDGTVEWTFQAGGAFYATPAIGEDGTLYAGCHDYNLYAINPDGTEKWVFPTNEYIQTTPAVGADGTIYLTSWDGNLYALTPDGQVRWQKFISLWWNKSSPVIGPDGVLYVGGNGAGYADHFYAFATDSGGLAPSPWPMHRQNPNHTSRRHPLALPPVPLLLDEPLQAELPPGEVQRYIVETDRDRNLLVELTPGEGIDALALDAGFGHVTHPGAGQFSTTVPTQRGTYELLISPTAEGAYMITVLGTRVTVNGGNYTLTARYVDAYLSELSPSSGGNVGEVSVSVRGLGFSAGVQVELGGAGLSFLTADEVSIFSATDLTARFDLLGAPQGMYDLVVRWPGGAQRSLTRAFTVTAGSGPSLNVQLSLPASVRPNRQYVYWLEYGNDGDTDMRAPLFLVSSPQNVRMRLSNDEPFSADGVQVLGISDKHPAGVLRPGERHRIPIFFESVLTSTIYVEVARLRADASVIDWGAIEAEIRPTGVTDELWNAIWANFQTAVGSTWGRYEEAFGEVATYLSRYGNPTYDANELFGTLFQRASANYLGEVHAFSLDAFSAARGVPLFLSRVAYGNLYQRFTPGPLGRCWSHSFEYELKRPASDRVVIRVPGGAIRTFFRDRSGRWQSLAGDYGLLEDMGGGAFRLLEKSGLILRFDASGLLVDVSGPDGNGLTFGYLGSRIETITHSNGQAITLEYNADGLIQYLTDHAGRVTEYIYDPGGVGLLETVIAPGGVSTEYRYGPSIGSAADHALVAEIKPDGTRLSYEHDSWGRVSTRSLGSGEEVLDFTYDRWGSVFETNGLDHTMSARIGSRGESLLIENHLGERASIEYDAHLNPTKLVLPDASQFEIVYDTRGNPTEVTNPLGEVVRAGYTILPDRLAWLQDPRGQFVDFRYENGKVARIDYPDGSYEAISYDPTDGDLETFASRKLDTISLGHNELGELTDIDWPDGTWFDFAHDELERRWTFSDARGTSTIDFDGRGFLEYAEGPQGKGIHYTCNDAGRRQRLETDDGFVLDYHYDTAGRLVSLIDGSGFEIIRYSYSESGRLEREQRGNGTATSYGYDGADRINSVTHYGPSGAVQSFFDFTYDSSGNPVAMMTPDGVTTFDYDTAGKLVGTTYPGGRRVVIDYDSAGNREFVTDDGLGTDYTVNNLNQYIEVGASIRAYDANGNLENLTQTSGNTTFSWDPENRLVAIESPETGVWGFTYDAFGHRIGVAHDGVSQHYLIDPRNLGDVVAEYDDSGILVARYIHGLGLAARLDAAGNYFYYGFDAIGNTRHLTDAVGLVVNRYDYSPFGILREAVEGVPNPFRFGGRYGAVDDGHGMLYMRARYYDPATGRFVSPDPIGVEGGSNLYAYVSNSPVRYRDPSGLGGRDFKQEFYDAGRRRNDAFWKIVTLEAENMKEAFEEYGDAREQVSKTAPLAAWEVAKDAAMGWATGPFYWKYPNGAWVSEWGDAAKDAYTTPPRPFSDETRPPHRGSPRDRIGSGSSRVVYPVDPNEKVGPAGDGVDHVVFAGEKMPYTVYFENLSTATAPAQQIFVSDCLDHNLDWTTFRLNDVVFGDTVAASSSASLVLRQRVSIPDYRPEEDKEWWVDVSSSFDLSTGCFRATLRQLDPETGDLPLDPFAGILPPEDGTGRGQGHLSYSVNAKDDLEDGRLIRNRASIVFDTNEPIWTNEVFNTIGSPQQHFTLTVSLAGDGFGTVTSYPAGIECGSACEESFLEDTVVELQTFADEGSEFAAWGGDDDCDDGEVTMNVDLSCEATFEISNRPPVAVAGPDQILFANELCEAHATLDGTGSYDPDDDPLTYHWQNDAIELSGETVDLVLPLGEHEFTLTVTDDQEASDSDTALITVEDETPPTIELAGDPVMTVECMELYSEPGATVLDNCDSELEVTIGGQVVDPQTPGDYVITYDAADAAGNQAPTVERLVSVTDTTTPIITAISASPENLWPPNHQMVGVSVSVSAADTCDAETPVCQITGVVSNEPQTGCGSGSAQPDWLIAGSLTLDLRAERCGDGDDRVYTIEVSCADSSGNLSLAETTVTVPHDQKVPGSRPGGRHN